MEDINKTIVVNYNDAREIMDNTVMECGCCIYPPFEEWYNNNEAFFLKKGMFIIENLMVDDNRKFLKYAFSFDLENPDESLFQIYNYYNQQVVCKFRYVREGNNPIDSKVELDFYNRRTMDSLNGDFTNQETIDKVDKLWEEFDKKVHRYTKQKQINNALKEFDLIGRKMEHEFMCAHTVRMFYAVMFYFSEQKPNLIKLEEYTNNEEKDIEVVFKKTKRKYYYTGYINLNQSKIYRLNNQLLKDNKRGEYQRHIEKWSVRGHYRIVNGKKIWIGPHEKGCGTLEKRIYGTQDESEVNVIPKVFEVNKNIAVECEVLSMPNNTEVVTEITDIISVNENTKLGTENGDSDVLLIQSIKITNEELITPPVIQNKKSLFQKLIHFIKRVLRIHN